MQVNQYPASSQQKLNLRHGFSLADLYDRDGLIRIDAQFLEFIGVSDPALRSSLGACRASKLIIS